MTSARIRKLEKAARITSRIFEEVVRAIKPGATEEEIASKIESLIKKMGLKRSFGTIVASGPNAAKPHAPVTRRKIRKGDAVVVDFGVIYRGEHSDMTRTVFAGSADPLMRRLYSAVRESQSLAIKAIKPGLTISGYVKKAHDLLRARGFGKYILHTLGHGIGQRVHEAPKLSEKNRRKLKKGMVVTIEPGLYVKGKGGVRIEDMVLITNNGGRILTI